MSPQSALRCYVDRQDPDAFRTLVEAYQNLVYAACRRQLPTAEVDDAVQEVFVKLARNADSIRQDIGSWIYRCAVNTCADTLRRKDTRARREAEYARRIEGEQGNPNVEQILRDVDQAMQDLSSEERQLIVRYFFAGETQSVIAQALDVSQPTIKRRIDQAVEHLRDKLTGSAKGVTAAALAAILVNDVANANPPVTVTTNLVKIGLSGTGAAAVSATQPSWSLLAKILVPASIAAAALVAVQFYFHVPASGNANYMPLAANANGAGPSAVSPASQTTPASSNPNGNAVPQPPLNNPAIPPMRILDLPPQAFVQELFVLPNEKTNEEQIKQVGEHLKELGLTATGPLTYRKPDGLLAEPETEIIIAIPVSVSALKGPTPFIDHVGPLHCASLLVPQRVPPPAAIAELDRQIEEAGLTRTYRDRFVSLDIGPNPRAWWEVQMGIAIESEE